MLLNSKYEVADPDFLDNNSDAAKADILVFENPDPHDTFNVVYNSNRVSHQ